MNLAGNDMLRCIYNVIIEKQSMKHAVSRWHNNYMTALAAGSSVVVALFVEHQLQNTEDPGSIPGLVNTFSVACGCYSVCLWLILGSNDILLYCRGLFLYLIVRAGFTTRHNSAKKQLTDLLSLHVCNRYNTVLLVRGDLKSCCWYNIVFST